MQRLKKLHLWFIYLLTVGFIIYLAGCNEYIVEHLYSKGIYPYSSGFLRTITSVLAFNIGDVIYIVLILYALKSTFEFFKNLFTRKLSSKKLASAPIKILNIGLIFYIAFKLLWGLNYSRTPINKTLGISEEKYDLTQLKQLGGYFILKLAVLKPDRSVYYSISSLENEAVNAYSKMALVHPVFKYNYPNVKPVLNSWFTSKIGIEGYYNPFTAEAGINKKLPQFVLPFTVCHEIGHQVGIGREDEANLMAYITASNSADVNFRYAAYYSMLTSILFELRMKAPEDFIKFYALLPPQVLADLKTEKAFWQKYNSELYGYMDTALDAYLKLNNQKMGIKSYQNIVLWVYNLHKEELKEM